MFHVEHRKNEVKTKIFLETIKTKDKYDQASVPRRTKEALKRRGDSMIKTICIANQKGGVGKTTTTVNLSAALASFGYKVLVVDMDPQGNASSGLGIKKHETQDANIYHALIGEKSIQEVIFKSYTDNLWVATANPDLVGAEIELVDMPQREFRLKALIQSVSSLYDYVLIDCPPSLGLLTLNSLAAASSFLV